MPTPLDPATLPDNVIALRTLLLHREDEHAAELTAARNGLKEQVLRNEQLKLRLAKLLRERFGASSEKLRGAIEQLELILAISRSRSRKPRRRSRETIVPPETDAPRRKPARKPLPEMLPRDVVEHPAPCACPKCGGSLRPLGEDVTEVLEYVPGSFRVTRHVRPKLSCRSVREHRAGPGTEPADLSWPGRTGTAGACAGGEILRPPAAVSPGRDLRPRRDRPGSFDLGGLGRAGGGASTLAPATMRTPGHPRTRCRSSASISSRLAPTPVLPSVVRAKRRPLASTATSRPMSPDCAPRVSRALVKPGNSSSSTCSPRASNPCG